MSGDNENIKIKFDFVRKDIEIRFESLKTELEDKAKELNDEVNQIESQILWEKTLKSD